MGNWLSTLYCSPDNSRSHQQTTRNLQTNNAILRETTNPDNPQYTVFISHAGEDKTTVAIPLREKLSHYGISAFVDEMDMPAGTEAAPAMISAIKSAHVAVIVLSPEFVARKWPMKELMSFLQRYRETKHCPQQSPVIIPFFYRLSIPEIYLEPRFDRKDSSGNSLYDASRFFQRMEAREPEANVESVKDALLNVRAFMGVRNYVDATNGNMLDMSRKRDILLNELRDKVRDALPNQCKTSHLRTSTGEITNRQDQGDSFRESFPPLSIGRNAILDFDSKDDEGNPNTTEGLIKHRILEHRSGVNRVISVRGIGGVGKSTIARALAGDKDVRRHFHDGIHLIKLGYDATEATVIHRICQMLRDSGTDQKQERLRSCHDMNDLFHEVEQWFKGKRCAFVIDDAWEGKIGIRTISQLCAMGRETMGTVVITTREHEVALLAPRENMFHLKPREVRGRQSREILFMHADQIGTKLGDGEEIDAINKILDICAGLPVSLAVAGKNVKKFMIGIEGHEEEAWSQYLRLLLICRESMLRKDIGEYGNLYATFSAALAFLDRNGPEGTLGFDIGALFGELHGRLCVLEKQEVAPCSLLKHLWGVESDVHAEMIGRIFVEIGLATEGDVVKPGNGMGSKVAWRLTLHDSIHDYALFEAKRKGDSRSAHERVIAGYRSFEDKKRLESTLGEIEHTEWWNKELLKDGYIHRNLCRHLLHAGRKKEVIWLLMRPVWTARQLETNGIYGLESDFSFALKAVEGIHEEWFAEIGAGRSELKRVLELISEAARLSWPYIGRNFREIWFQLYGRLKRLAVRHKGIMEYISEIEKEAMKPSWLPWMRCENSFLTEPGGANKRIISVGFGIECMVKIKDQQLVVCGCYGGYIAAGNMRKSDLLMLSKAHDDAVSCVGIGRDETRLLSGSEDGTVKVWDIESRSCVTTFMCHTKPVKYIAVMRDGKRVISGSEEEMAQVWDMDTGQAVSQLFKEHEGLVSCIEVLLVGEREYLIIGGRDKKLRLWDVTSDAQVGQPFIGHEHSITCVFVAPEARYVVSGSHDGTLRAWDLETHKQLGGPLKGHTDSITCVSISEDGKRIASGACDNTIRVWNFHSGKETCDGLRGHTSNVTSVSFFDGSDSVVSGSEDGTIRVWNVRERSEELEHRHEKPVFKVAFTPNSEYVVSCSFDMTLRIWDVKSCCQVGDPLKQVFPTSVVLTPDGHRFISTSCNKKVCVWDLHSRKVVYTFTGHTASVRCVAVTPNGQYAVTGSKDKTVRVWDLGAMDGSHVILEGHNADVCRVHFSYDGKRIVSADSEHKVIVWELDSRRRVQNMAVERAWRMSKKELMDCIGEPTEEVDVILPMLLGRRTFAYGEGENKQKLASLEASVFDWALSPNGKTICLGLEDGKVALMTLVR